MRMQISVLVLSEREAERDTIALEVIPNDKIETVKAQIEQIQQSLPPCKQLLLYAGQQLEDGCSLEKYGVEDGSTILLVFKPNGMVVTIRRDDSESSFMKVDVESTSTIADVKQCIDHLNPGKLSPEVNLHFNGELLEDNLTLADYGVEPLSTLMLSEILCLYIWLSPRETISVKVLTSDEIGNVKDQVIRNKHLPHGHYVMNFSGSRLEDTKRVSDYNIGYESTLSLYRIAIRASARSSNFLTLVVGIIGVILCCPCLTVLAIHDRIWSHRQLSNQRLRYANRSSLEEEPSVPPSPPKEVPTAPVSTTSETSTPTSPAEQVPTPVQEQPPVTIPIVVSLPLGRSITVGALGTDSIRDIKAKIEAADPIYPSPHQRLVEPGRCDDLLDNDEIRNHLFYSNRRFVLRGKLISVNIRKHDGLPGFLTLFLEYFDTIKRIKEEVYLDKNMKVSPNQQQIYFEEKLLDDDNLTLSQCGIKNGSQVAIKVLAPSCQQLMSELLKDSEACRYERFAVNLGLSPDTVEVITMNHRDAHRCLIDVINYWVNNSEVSWSAVTTALDCIDCRNMAETIRCKYNVIIA